MNRTVRCLLAATSLLSVATAARAADDKDKEPLYPVAVIDRPFTVFEDMKQISLGLDINLGASNAFKPMFPSATVDYGFNNDLQFSANLGLCFNGQGNGCNSAASEVTLSATYSTGSLGPIATAVFLRAQFPSFTPAEFAIPFGALLRYTPAPELFSIVAAPQFAIALTDRNAPQPNPGGDFAGNFDTFSLPFQFQLQATEHFEFQLNVALNVQMDPQGANPSPMIPLGAGMSWAITRYMDVGGSFTYLNLFGKNGNGLSREMSFFYTLRI